MSFHIGRSWSGHFLEDTCPCPKAPCGLVNVDQADPACPEHPAERSKSIRQSHPASECPGRAVVLAHQHRIRAVSTASAHDMASSAAVERAASVKFDPDEED